LGLSYCQAVQHPVDANLGAKSHRKSPMEMSRETKGRVQFQKLKFIMTVCSCLCETEGSTPHVQTGLYEAA